VKLIRLNDNDAIGSVTKIEREEDQIAEIADSEMTTLPEGETPDQPSAVIEE
jgi:hypothetical protein